MINFLKNKGYYIYGILFLVSILPFSGKLCKQKDVLSTKHELFDSSLTKIQNVSSAVLYINEKYNSRKHFKFDTIEYVQLASDFTKKRFYHGLTHYSISDNWIAFLSGKIFWSHLSAIVDPDDILKHPEGLCSQQTIVFMDILRRKNIVTRNVGLGYKEGPGHFLAEVFYNNTWHMYDVNLEPKWDKITNRHKSVDYYKTYPDSLLSVYEGILDKNIFYKIIGKVNYGNSDEFPAQKMYIFQKICLLFSYLFPFIFFLLCIYQYKKIKI